MASEHVRDAKQATGVRATSQTYNKHNVKLYVKTKHKTITENTELVTLFNYLATHCTTEITRVRHDGEKGKRRNVRACSVCAAVKA